MLFFVSYIVLNLLQSFLAATAIFLIIRREIKNKKPILKDAKKDAKHLSAEERAKKEESEREAYTRRKNFENFMNYQG